MSIFKKGEEVTVEGYYGPLYIVSIDGLYAVITNEDKTIEVRIPITALEKI